MSTRDPFKMSLKLKAGTGALVAVWLLSLTTVVSFLPPQNGRATRTSLSIGLKLSSQTAAICEITKDSPISKQSTRSTWLDKGLLLSSFTDGLKTNPIVVDWLMSALVESLWKEEQAQAQLALKESNLASPCNGPDPVFLDQLEETDRALENMRGGDWKKNLQLYCETKRARNGESNPLSVDLRFLYIPTAMYALRPESTSTPGKQRGRNRADGKKRRNEIMGLLQRQLEEFASSSEGNADVLYSIRTVTMDFDDCSVKQPEIVTNSNSLSETDDEFPETGKQAIRQWQPHFIYVQGGNTFWLHYCMEKGDWTKDLIDACCYNPNNDNEIESPFSAVYCGVSAGAILAGESMQTACWKEWDNPSVVPGKETYEDWADVRGLDVAGRTSIFPHMTEEWQDVAERKTEELLESTLNAGNDDDLLSSSVCCIRDDQAYIVNGRRQTIEMLS